MTSSPPSDAPGGRVLYCATPDDDGCSRGPGFIECDDGTTDLLELYEGAGCGAFFSVGSVDALDDVVNQAEGLPPMPPCVETFLRSAAISMWVLDSDLATEVDDWFERAGAYVSPSAGQSSAVWKLPSIAPAPSGSDERVIARFHPQAWVQAHAVEVDPRGEVEWDVTEFFHGLPPSEREEYARADTDLSDMLCFEGDPPEWVRAWQGPFYVEVFFESGERSGAPALAVKEGLDSDPGGLTRIQLGLVFTGDIPAASVIQHLRETFNDDGSLLEAREL